MESIPHAHDITFDPRIHFLPETLMACFLKTSRFPQEAMFLFCDTAEVWQQLLPCKTQMFTRRTIILDQGVLLSAIYVLIESPHDRRFFGTLLNPFRDRNFFEELAIQPHVRFFFFDPDRQLWDLSQIDDACQTFAKRVLRLTTHHEAPSDAAYSHALRRITMPYPSMQDFWAMLPAQQEQATQLPSAPIGGPTNHSRAFRPVCAVPAMVFSPTRAFASPDNLQTRLGRTSSYSLQSEAVVLFPGKYARGSCRKGEYFAIPRL